MEPYNVSPEIQNDNGFSRPIVKEEKVVTQVVTKEVKVSKNLLDSRENLINQIDANISIPQEFIESNFKNGKSNIQLQNLRLLITYLY